MTDHEDDDKCGLGDDDHQVLLKIEFELREEDDAAVSAAAAVVNTHLHNVPNEVAARTLLLIAHKIIADELAHTTFEGCPSHALAHAMAHAAATAYVIDAAKNVPMVEAMNLNIPDDISSLLEEG